MINNAMGCVVCPTALGNLRIGTNFNYGAAIRWKAKYSAAVAGVRVFYIMPIPFNTGYTAGTGGTIKCELCQDNGSGQPGTVLASHTWAPALVGQQPADNHYGFYEHVFSVPPLVAAGTTYYFKFTNIDADPTANYTSLNCLYAAVGQISPDGVQFGQRDANDVLQVLFGVLPGTLSEMTPGGGEYYVPIFDVRYITGLHQGQGVMEVGATTKKSIATPNRVRNTFVIAAPIAFTKIAAFARIITAGTLVVNIKTASGALMASASQAVSVSGGGIVSEQFLFTVANTSLSPGAYFVEVFMTSGSGEVQCVRDGSGPNSGNTFGFDAATTWATGNAEFSTDGGLTWLGWHTSGVLNLPYTDIPVAIESLTRAGMGRWKKLNRRLHIRRRW